MSLVHSKDTYVSLGGVDLSSHVSSSELSREADVHDVTTYGQTAHTYYGGLLNGTAKLEGFYDSSSSTGPRAVIRPLIGTTSTLIRRPEGTGVGLPQDSASVVVKGFVESSPVADMIKWTCDLQISGAVTSTTQ
jgi:hypothetical protein